MLSAGSVGDAQCRVCKVSALAYLIGLFCRYNRPLLTQIQQSQRGDKCRLQRTCEARNPPPPRRPLLPSKHHVVSAHCLSCEVPRVIHFLYFYFFDYVYYSQ